jgi:tetratricopeptide (TPR) repeat protein
MIYDPSNPVVQLCVKGIETEQGGDVEKADTLYRQAWEQAVSDVELFTAAHYLARTQKDPQDELKWNLVALAHADMVKDEQLGPVYPSLFLNVAKSYEALGDAAQALLYYRKAQESAGALDDSGYGKMIRSGIAAGLQRVTP